MPRSHEHLCKCKVSVNEITKNEPFVIKKQCSPSEFTGQQKILPIFGDKWVFHTVSLNGLQWFQKYLEEGAGIIALYHLGKRGEI